MKKLAAMLLTVLLLLGPAMPVMANSAPISRGTINTVTYLRWGKGELFPTLALVGPGRTFDVFEYDKDWVMVLYDTWLSQGTDFTTHSFYCFVKRADITCDPPLENEDSEKADTGLGKRKGKSRKPKPTATATAGASASVAASQTATASKEPEPSVEVVDDEEYDWIIRTPGLCSVTIPYQEANITVSFALMAQKAGGTSPSSAPAFNHGIRTPYAAMGAYQMLSPMADILENMGVSGFLQGSGGVDVSGQTSGSKFYLDTGAMDPALVNFTVRMQGQYTLNPKVTGENASGEFSASGSMPLDLPVQLRKAGGGYSFVLVGMRPGGGDLTFPAVLEKTFADPDRWDKEARDADRRREEADRMLKELKEKIKQRTQEEYQKKQAEKANEESRVTEPIIVKDSQGNDVELAPLVPVTEDPLAPLVPVTDDLLAPLVPTPDEEVADFPSRP